MRSALLGSASGLILHLTCLLSIAPLHEEDPFGAMARDPPRESLRLTGLMRSNGY
jgi:hypothetical protein